MSAHEKKPKKAPANAGKKQAKDTKFQPGQSGNPAGKRKGTRHKSTMAALALLEGEAQALTRVCIEKAKAGDMGALRLCFERLIPIARERPVKVALPNTETVTGIERACDKVLQAAAAGDLTVGEAAAFSTILKERRIIFETSEFERRLCELEEKINSK